MNAPALPNLWAQIETRLDDLPPQLRRAAIHMRERPQEVALGSLRSVAASAGVSPASITRLLATLGIGSWDAFQQSHRDWLLAGHDAPFSPKAAAVIGGASGADADDLLLDRLLEMEHSNLAASLSAQNRRAVRDAADMLAGCDRIGIVGLRSCFPIAYSLAYSLSLFRPGIRQITGIAGVLLDELMHLSAGDGLVVVSVIPYTRDAIRLAAQAREMGIRVIAITDSPMSPLARRADKIILVQNESPAPIASPIGPLIATQALTLELLVRAGAPAHDAIRRREAMLADAAIYHPDI